MSSSTGNTMSLLNAEITANKETIKKVRRKLEMSIWILTSELT